jgi:general secretion pathway protein G
LLELLVVLLIIALLAGYVGPRLFGEVGKARIQTTKSQMKTLADALDHFRLDTGRYPSTEEGLQALVRKPGALANWSGPYLQKDVPFDPWGRAYVYAAPGDDGHEFRLLSYGMDGVPGGTGENVDISYW